MDLRALGKRLAANVPESVRAETSNSWGAIAETCLENGIVTFDSQQGILVAEQVKVADDQKQFQTIFRRITEPAIKKLQEGKGGYGEAEQQVAREQAFQEYAENGGTTSIISVTTAQRAYISGYTDIDTARFLAVDLNVQGFICLIGELQDQNNRLNSFAGRLPLTLENGEPVTTSPNVDMTKKDLYDDLEFAYAENVQWVTQELDRVDPDQLAYIEIIDPVFSRTMEEGIIPAIAEAFESY